MVYGLFILICLLALPASSNAFMVVHGVSEQRPRLARVWVESSGDESSSATTCETEAAPTVVELPPVLKSIADERREFQMNLGKAMDTLRSDMQQILQKRPDFSIYDESIILMDPSGVQLKGLEKYKSGFAFFQTFVGFWFSQSKSGLQYRMVYDFCRSSIRISWHAVLVPKVPLGRPLYVDGISYYSIDRTSGKIVEHKIEKLIMNNTPVTPPYGILSLLQQDALRLHQPQGVPVGIGAMIGDSMPSVVMEQ